MRNIWAIVVAVVLIGGAAVSLFRLLGGNEPTVAERAPPPPPTASREAVAAAPAPETNVGRIAVRDDDFVIGKAEAPITIVEYASFTCPHCARFHVETLPGLKKEFIDTGKVRLVYRDFPLDQVALTASMIARCAGRKRYFGFVTTFFTTQSSWARDSNPVAALGRLARLGGLSQADFAACLKNQEIGDAVLKQRLEGEKTYKVRATPTLIINGDVYSGALTLAQMRTILNAMLAKS